MNAIRFSAYVALISLCGFTSCTENPHDNDPTSTITPGNKLEVDSATAHSNNSFEEAKTKTGSNTDNSVNSDNHNSGSNNVSSGTKENDNVKPKGNSN